MQELDRNSIIGFILLGVLMVVYMMWQGNRSQALQEAQQQISDSLAVVEQQRVADSLFQVGERREVTPGQDNTSPDELEALQRRIDSLQQARTSSDRQNEFGPFSESASGSESLYTIEDEHLSLTLSNKGGQVVRARLNQFKDFRGRDLVLFEPEDHSLGLTFYTHGQRKINTSQLFGEAKTDPDGKGIRFRFKAGPGRWLEQIYRLTDDPYAVDYRLEFQGFDQLLDTRTDLEFGWDMAMRRQETNLNYERQMSKAYFRTMSGSTDFKSRDGKEDFVGKVQWLSYVDQFFNATLIAEDGFDSHGGVTVRKGEDDDTTHTKHFESRLYTDLPRQAEHSMDMRFLFAPNHYRALKKMDLELERVVPVGRSVIRWCNVYAIIPLFNWLNRMIGNYGLIILILTFLIKMVLTPFTYRSYLSMAKMRVLKPEMDALKEKFGEDQQRMSRETMKLYQQTGVSPLGGCLPMVFQMPILFAMYRFFPNSIELRQESFLWAHDLSSYDVLFRLPMEVPMIGAHISGFTLLAGITSLAYARLNSQMTPQTGGINMQFMQYLFPLMMIFIFNKFSSALTYYYVLQNIISFGQQWIMRRFFIDEEALHKQIQEKKAKPRKKSAWVKRLEAYTQQQQSTQAAKKKSRSQTGKPKKR